MALDYNLARKKKSGNSVQACGNHKHVALTSPTVGVCLREAL